MEVERLRNGFPPEYGVWDGVGIGRALLLRGEVDVPTLPKRRAVTICFPGPPSTTRPIIFVSGPRTSRHRFRTYRPSDLCLYYGRDHSSLKWNINHGLVGLVDLIRAHLYKEEWWRATAQWPGPEVHRDRTPAQPGAPLGTPTVNRRHARRRCWCGAPRYSECHGAMPAADELRLLGIDSDARLTLTVAAKAA